MASPQITAPTSALNAQQGGKYVFPEGLYQATIEATDVRGLPARADGTPFSGYATTDGERLSIRFGDITPQEGQDAVGNRKKFLDLVLADGEHDLYNVDIAAKDQPYWQLQRSAVSLFKLAAAMNETTTTDDTTTINDGFLDALKSGAYNGSSVVFRVFHRVSKGTTYDEIGDFFAA